MSRRSSNSSTLKRPHDSVNRDDCISVAPSETGDLSYSQAGSVQEINNIPGRERADSSATTTSALSRMRTDSIDENGKSGPEGSKWKLLKALKERKAEEKIQEEANATSTAVR
jgi:hypothetical protein